MIAKLRRKFTLLVLAGLLVITVATVVSINTFNWYSVCRQAESALSVLAGNEGQRPLRMEREGGESTEPPEKPSWDDRNLMNDGKLPGQFDRRGGFFAEDASMVNLSNSYAILLDEAGEIEEWISDRSDLYDDEEIASLAAEITASGKTSGRVGGQFFRVEERDGGKLLVVLDARLEVSGAKRLLRSTLLIAALGYFLMSVGAVLIIRRMIAPVQESFEKQKQFVWDASHELKTPLAVISANAEVLAAEIGPNESLEYIQSEVTRTDHLVQNLLTLARMDRGTVTVNRSQFDLSRALLSVALPFESTVFEAGKTLEMDIDEGVACVGDEDMLKQLALILLSNAVKYSDDAGTITLSLKTEGGRRVLRVHNTGEPIRPDAIPRLFDRFYRADSSHNREIAGNGLGLAIAKDICDMHHAKIAVESAEGRGTTFTVTLP